MRQVRFLKRAATSAVVLLLFGGAQMNGQTPLVAQPIPDRTVAFRVSDTGVSRPMLWGLDTAWPSEGNMRRGVAFMGAGGVDVVRVSFQPTLPLVNGDLQQDQINWINTRLNLVNWTGPNTKVVLNCDHPSVDAWYSGNAARWAQLMDVSTKRYQDAGRTVVSISPFNEPDYGWGQGTITDFYNICGELKNNPRFANIRISGGNTLNNDQALPWYNQLKARLDEGNTHQLAGSFDNFAAFYQAVRANGDYATGDELHNVMEAMVGFEYGMQTGIWWGTAELARGEFCKASDGVRLGYAEHRPNWTAASVYRAPDGKEQAFGGTSERQAATTTYRFVSKEREVYFDGYGPQREYTMVMPGGTGYQTGQTNAERVVNITWGDDIQPAVNGRYVLVNRNSGKVMEVTGGSAVAGAAVQQSSNTGATYQQWDVVPVDSRVGGDFSYFTLTAAHSGKALDLINWSLNNGGNIQVWDDIKGGNQQWYLDYAGDGWFYIRSRQSAKCLDVYNLSTADGAPIVQWDKGGNNQQWRFLPVGAPVEFVAPNAPAGLVATANAESVQLTWTASSSTDVAGYTVFRADASGGAYNTIARNVTTTTFVDNTATSGGPYYYKVKAVDNSLNRSAYSNEVSATPTNANAVVAAYAFDGSVQDNSVNLNHASTYGTVAYVTGKVGTNAISLNGSNAFVQLPATLANQQEITVAAWVYWNGGSAWQRIFDFGNGTDEYMFLSPKSGSGQLCFAIKNGGAEQVLNAPALATGVWSHVAVTLGAAGASIYVNGTQVATSTAITISPLNFKPVLNYIGRSQYPDPLLNGSVDNFRVYNYVLPASEVLALSGVKTGHIYMLQSKLSGKVMDVLGAVNGSQVIQFDNWNNANQKWLLQQDATGYWSFTPQNASTKALDVPNCNFTNGIQLNIWDTFGNDCQKFQMVDMGDGYFQVRVKDGSKCLDVYGASLDNLAQVVLWDCHTADNQQWRLIDGGLKSASLTSDEANSGDMATSLPLDGTAGVAINAYPNPVGMELSVAVDNFSGQVRVDIYGVAGRLEKQAVGNIEGSGKIVVPRWGYKGLGLVKVTAGQDVKVFKMDF